MRAEIPTAQEAPLGDLLLHGVWDSFADSLYGIFLLLINCIIPAPVYYCNK